MSSRRTAKVAQAILESVSSTVLFGLKDPRVKNVTVTSVEVSRDIRSAKVYVSVMGDEKQQALCMHGLNSARGYLQSKIGDRLRTRYTPALKFVLDPGIKQSIETAKILREIAESEQSEGVEAELPQQQDSEDANDPPAEIHTENDPS